MPGLDNSSGTVESVFADDMVFEQFVPKGADRIRLLPALDLFFRPVARCIGRGVAADPVGDRIQQNRSAAFAQHFPLTAESIDDRQWIVSVYALRVHLLGIDSCADAGNKLNAHGLAEGLASHAVEVIHAVENDRQAAAQGLVPEMAVLIHGAET